MDKQHYIVCTPSFEGGLGFDSFIQTCTLTEAQQYLRDKKRNSHTLASDRDRIRLYQLVEVK
jgi:hypothetical protein